MLLSLKLHGGGIDETALSLCCGEFGGKMSKTGRGAVQAGLAVIVVCGDWYGEPVSVK